MYMVHTGHVIHQRRCDTNQPGPISSRRLRSADTTDYAVPRTRTKFGDRAFCVAGPTRWNSLPESLRTDCTETFKRRLKTHFLASTSPPFCFNFSPFLLTLIMAVRLVVDLALNTIEHWTFVTDVGATQRGWWSTCAGTIEQQSVGVGLPCRSAAAATAASDGDGSAGHGTAASRPASLVGQEGAAIRSRLQVEPAETLLQRASS